jgi:uncharacterized ubiquitin-like protein YukD
MEMKNGNEKLMIYPSNNLLATIPIIIPSDKLPDKNPVEIVIIVTNHRLSNALGLNKPSQSPVLYAINIIIPTIAAIGISLMDRLKNNVKIINKTLVIMDENCEIEPLSRFNLL